MAGRPLRPATDHRHGRPLPHHLANRPQDPLSATPKSLSSHSPSKCELMRNYPPFPRATPHQKAGFPRVPHPSATRISEETTFDLHALGTPPALILSQDQTLHQVFVRPSMPRSSSGRPLAVISYPTPAASSPSPQLSMPRGLWFFVHCAIRAIGHAYPLPERSTYGSTPSSAHKQPGIVRSRALSFRKLRNAFSPPADTSAGDQSKLQML